MSDGSAWETETSSVDETMGLGRSLAPLLRPGDVVLLTGDLGAGKTQFSKGVAAGLGSNAKVTSPTFNIMLVYDDGRLPLYHFDLYRLDDSGELDDLDYFGILEDDGVSLVEWGDRFEDALPEQYVLVRIHVAYEDAETFGDAARQSGVEPAPGSSVPAMPVQGATDRRVVVQGFGERGEELVSGWVETTREAGAAVWSAVGR
jgi:tRNA threonylcarbamoyladenosine biosynthesis protein TsaE